MKPNFLPEATTKTDLLYDIHLIKTIFAKQKLRDLPVTQLIINACLTFPVRKFNKANPTITSHR